jgi:hypothetical protein
MRQNLSLLIILMNIIYESEKILLTKQIEVNGAISVAALPAGMYSPKNNIAEETQKIIVTK